MLRKQLYDAIFKRRSFHLFRNIGNESISDAELEGIAEVYKKLTPLCPDIKTKIKIVPSRQATFGRGSEYCILFYSEKKENYLQNIGYIGEQLDLHLVSKNIGTLWLGLGKTEELTLDGLDFVIMMAISKVDDEKKFRKDMYKSKRKPVEEIWQGEHIEGATDIARFAPSACNSQPWRVENKNGELTVSRFHKQGKVGIMTPTAAAFFNRIDMGIFLAFLDICLEHSGTAYERELFPDNGGKSERTLNAVYKIHK